MIGLQTFAPTALNAAFDVPLALSRRRRSPPICSAARPASSPAASSRRAPTHHDRVAAPGSSPARCCSCCVATVAAGARALLPLFATDRLRARAHRPVARSHRAQRDAARRGGPRLRFRLFGARPRRRRSAPIWFGCHARSRRGARRVLRGRRRACWSRSAPCVQVRRAVPPARPSAARRSTMMDLGIAGRRALVCAASKGLGRGCAEALARRRVRGHDRRAHRGRAARDGGGDRRRAPARPVRWVAVRHHDAGGPRRGARRVPATRTSWSTTPAARRPAISATGTATRGSARSTPTC